MDRYSVLRERGNKCFRCKKYDFAIEFYQKCLELCEEEKYVIFSNLSACYLRMNENSKALELAQKSLELAPQYEKAHIRLIRSYIGLGEYEYANFLMSPNFIRDEFKSVLRKEIDQFACPSNPYSMKLVRNISGPKIFLPNQHFHERRKGSIFESNTFYTFCFRDRIFMFGGRCQYYHRDHSELLVLEGTTWRRIRTSGVSPIPVSHHRIFLDEESKRPRLYVWGGDFRNTDQKSYNLRSWQSKLDVTGNPYELDLETFYWRRLQSSKINTNELPEPRAMSTLGKVRSKLYIIGGVNMKNMTQKPGQSVPMDNEDGDIILTFDLEKNEWGRVPLSPPLDKKLKMGISFSFQNNSVFYVDKNDHPTAIIALSIPTRILQIDLELGSYKLFKIPFFTSIQSGVMKWDGKDVSPTPFAQTWSTIHAKQNRRFPTLFCLYLDRYLLELNLEEKRWEKIANLTNLKIVSDLKEKKQQISDQVIENNNNSSQSRRVRFFQPYNPNGLQLELDPNSMPYQNEMTPQAEKNDGVERYRISNQFHSIAICKDVLYCFCTPNPQEGSMIRVPRENSMAVVRIESRRNRILKKLLFEKVKRKTFSDIFVKCVFF